MTEREKKLSPRGMLLFALPFFAVGAFMGGCNAWTVAKHHAAQSWVEVPAVIEQADLTEHHDSEDGTTTYEATATYTYELAGRRYTGHRVSLHSGSDNLGSFQQNAYNELKRHRDTRQPFRCYVNPANPQESVLYRQLRWEMMLMLAGGGGLFGSIGVGMFTAGWVRRRRSELAKSDQDVVHVLAAGGPPVVTRVLIAIAVWWNLAALPLLVALPTMFREAGTWWAWLTLLVPAIGASMVFAALNRLVRRPKQSDSQPESAQPQMWMDIPQDGA